VPTPVPTPMPRTADVGYYNEETRASLVPGVAYINLFGTRIYYTIPNERTIVPLEGNASNWSVSQDKYKIIESAAAENGEYIVKAKSTGYVYFKNKTTGETAKLYVNQQVQKTEKNKQTNKALPYYLYAEKGSYTSFVKETIALTVYTVDKDGYYTVPYLTICTATGSAQAKTPAGYHTIGGTNVGTFTMEKREYWHCWGGDSYSQYAINYSNGVYIHAPTATGKCENGVWPSAYNGVGTHASGGCLRMYTGYAYWIWCNCPNGTTLEIVEKNPRGTCIELQAAISGGNQYDPTDPYLLTLEHFE